MTVELDDREAAAIAAVFGGLIRDAAVAGRPTPHSVVRLWRRLNLAVEVSACGQRNDGDLKPSTQISTSDAARLIGWGERRTRRHANDLGACRVGGRLVYDEQAVREYAEAFQQKGIRDV